MIGDEGYENRDINEATAGAQAVNPSMGVPESGMPAGGPGDLATRAQHEAGEKREEPQDPFGAGIDARANGVMLEDCPYPAESEEGRIWQDGWNHRSSMEADI